MKNLLSYLENRKARLEKEIKELENEKKESSRRVSEIQVMIIGLTGELNATNETIKEVKGQKQED